MLSKKRLFLLHFAILFVAILSSAAQNHIDFEDYAGFWKGQAEIDGSFKINVRISDLVNDKASLIFSNHTELFRKEFTLSDTPHVQLDEKIYFEGIVDKSKSQITGFIKIGIDFYPVELKKRDDIFTGILNLAANHYLQTESHYLEIRKVYNSVEGYGAYPLLGTYWVNDLNIEGDQISFEDYKTGLIFKGKLQDSSIILSVHLGSIVLSEIRYAKIDQKDPGKRINLADGWNYSDGKLLLTKLEKDIDSKALKGIESVLVAQDGKIRYEEYFNGTNNSVTNDWRSAGKSIGSAIVGIAVDEGIITSVEEKVYDHLPEAYQYTKDEGKSKITVEHLLTMRSGIGVYENYYQETDDWLKTVLEPKLKYDAGTHTNYMSSDPFLLSVNLSERLPIPLEFYIHEKLFAPLQISNYILNTDDKGNPYFAGGIYMTPRDMLKFGQLYLNKGLWNDQRIISEEWVTQSFKKHTKFENPSNQNAYGYLWWHETYMINGKSVAAIEARGNGGQYVCILSELNTVIVVTTENYNKRGAGPQTERIIESYILAELVK